MNLSRVTISNPLFGSWDILTDLPEYLFSSIYNSWCDIVPIDNICKESLCQHIIKNGYAAMTDEVYNLLFKKQ